MPVYPAVVASAETLSLAVTPISLFLVLVRTGACQCTHKHALAALSLARSLAHPRINTKHITGRTGRRALFVLLE